MERLEGDKREIKMILKLKKYTKQLKSLTICVNSANREYTLCLLQLTICNIQ
jgi:hypothetical protein